MILKNRNLHLVTEDFETLKMLLNELTPITEDTDYMELDVPLLIPSTEMLEDADVNIKEIDSISYDTDNAIIGSALLYHFREYQKYLLDKCRYKSR